MASRCTSSPNRIAALDGQTLTNGSTIAVLMSKVTQGNGAEKFNYSLQGSGWLMFRVIAKHDMFDLQAVLLMCWINCVEHETSSLRQSSDAPSHAG
jgi:hypothetical protein